ncbi:MAG: phosphotransferase [Terriglobia bacterium]
MDHSRVRRVSLGSRNLIYKIGHTGAASLRIGLENEISCLKTFRDHPPAFSAPILLMVPRPNSMITWGPQGDALSSERFLSVPRGGSIVQLAERSVELADLIQKYDGAPRSGWPKGFDLVARLARCRQVPGFNSLHENVIAGLLGDATVQFGHGDLIPPNIVRHHGRVSAIDWEYAGMWPPRWDLGQLWCSTAMVYDFRRVVEVAMSGDAEFAAAASLQACHEWRIHFRDRPKMLPTVTKIVEAALERLLEFQ